MSRKGRNNRREPRKQLKPAKRKQKKQTVSEEILISKIEENIAISKRYLILCEGETEEAYFSGLKNNILLKEKFQSVQIEIIPPYSKNRVDVTNTLRDNSLKGMVWEAMKRKRKAKSEKNPYNEIWLVIDNDERNSYIISKKTIHKAKQLLDSLQLSKFSNYLDNFFLSKRHYDNFLINELGLTKQLATRIINLTDKNSIFENYAHPNPKKQFYCDNKLVYGKNHKNLPDEKDFDSQWKTWLKLAYSCRTFENWLILHFEACKIPFTLSKEYPITEINPFDSNNSIHYLWQFIPDYAKGHSSQKANKLDSYNCLKPQPFNSNYETEIEAQYVIDKVRTAILNGYWLRQQISNELTLQNGIYYEVNPYTDVDALILSLLEENIIYGLLGQSIYFDGTELILNFNRVSHELHITLINYSDKRLLINNTNISQFFKILRVLDNYSHEYIYPISINGTLNIPFGVLQGKQRTILFPPFSINRDYLIFQNFDSKQFLYLPL